MAKKNLALQFTKNRLNALQQRFKNVVISFLER